LVRCATIQPERNQSEREVAGVVEREGGAVSIMLAAPPYPTMTIQLHVVPGQYAEPPESFNPSPVEIRDRDGLIVRPPDGSISLLWQEYEEVAMELSASPVTETELAAVRSYLQDLADDIVETNESTWEAFREQHSE